MVVELNWVSTKFYGVSQSGWQIHTIGLRIWNLRRKVRLVAYIRPRYLSAVYRTQQGEGLVSKSPTESELKNF